MLVPSLTADQCNYNVTRHLSAQWGSAEVWTSACGRDSYRRATPGVLNAAVMQQNKKREANEGWHGRAVASQQESRRFASQAGTFLGGVTEPLTRWLVEIHASVSWSGKIKAGKKMNNWMDRRRTTAEREWGVKPGGDPVSQATRGQCCLLNDASKHK